MKRRLIIIACLTAFFGIKTHAAVPYNVNGDNFSYLFDVYKPNDKALHAIGETLKSPFEITQNYLKPLFITAKNWANIIRPVNAGGKPANYGVFALDDYNASAASVTVNVKESPYRVTYINAVINNLDYTIPKIFDGETPYSGYILLGKGISEENSGWAPFTGNHSLYHGEIPDLNVVMMHELMHSLGITSGVQTYKEDYNDDTPYFSESKSAPISIYDANLRVYNGDMSQPFDKNLEIIPKSGMSVGKGKKFDIDKNSPYFTGDNVIKVLGGKNDYGTSKQAIIDNEGLINYSGYYKEYNRPKVYGLPIHPYDGTMGDDEVELDLSHIELRNSYMSHQDFRNWTTPMEVELAVLKDVGYDIDLRRHFGKSYYLNNVTDTFTTGYSEWDGSSYTGAPSKVTQGVGLHIYGNSNNISQASDILTNGEGSIGARIEGVGNVYTLKSGNRITTNGKENLGIAVTWGKDHNINVEQGATVQAKGKEGIAASFDFGTNIFGTTADAMGSYINYDSLLETNNAPAVETRDALVDEFNVSGTLEGKKAAIYISDNAHVKNINILDGAQIKGDIISEWNSVSSSGDKIKVQRLGSIYWENVDPNDKSQIYFTNLNIDKDFSGTIDGKIDGDNEVYNTLRLNNAGKPTIKGEEINVYEINNIGDITVNDVTINAQSGTIFGNGNIKVNTELELGNGISNIENNIKLSDGAVFSTINDETIDININSIESNNGKISFDMGDTYVLKTNSNNNKAAIGQVKVDEYTAKELKDKSSVELFKTDANTKPLDLGKSKANVYYNGNRYTLTQNPDKKDFLDIRKTASNMELKDAAEDKTAANYIVTKEKLTKDAGTVKGDVFEISGNNIDVNGHKGLVIDKSQNKDGIILKTGIKGAADSNLTVKNNGILTVDAERKNIQIGNKGETSVNLNKGLVKLNAGDNSITISGDIKGSDNKSDKIVSEGSSVKFSNTSNVMISSKSVSTEIGGTSKNTVWDLSSALINVPKDSYLASDGSNQLILNGGFLNLQNNKASDIKLAKMTMNKDFAATIDVDLKDLTTDRFVFKNSSDLKTNNNLLYLSNVKMLNSDKTTITGEKVTIPFASKQYHNEKLIGGIVQNIKPQKVLTPIFKYNFDYEENKNMAGFVLTRGSSSDYSNYNPAIMAAPVAAQIGGYLTQLNSYDEAFRNLDMKMLMTREERKAYKMANLYASTVRPKEFSPTYLPEKESAGWFRPYVSFEKVGLNHGPKVKNNMYGSFFGGDSQMFETKNGWDYQYSVYAGYNGSHQNYSGNSIYQNGGHLGLSGIWYKKDFFTSLTANVGASVAEASTMYGHEDFPMIMTGVASKTGYNWELAHGKFIIQPSYMMSYSFVNTFDYTNAADVRINSKPLNAINITPGIKFIGNLKNGWQPYMGVQMVWNIMDKTDYKVQNVNLPELSVKPYIQYGVGVQKRWGERFTGFGQVMIRNGGRNGVAFNLGFRWTLGKNSNSKNKNNNTQSTRTVIKSLS